MLHSSLKLAVFGAWFATLACTAEPSEVEPDVAEVALPAAFNSLQPGWNTFEPGGETTCSDGSPFRYFARPGDPEKLVVYFQGGGACWTGETCDRDRQPTYTTTAVSALIEAKPGEPRPEGAMNGIFDFTRDDNPVRDYSMVFVPYCTGDVHIGNRTATYQTSTAGNGGEVTVEHKGIANSMAALNWAFQAFDRPATVLVTGSSAGSIPSPYYAHLVQSQYPAARVVQLGDGAGGYRRTPGSSSLPHTQWGTLEAISETLPRFAGMADEDFNYEQLYIATGEASPQIQLAEYDAAEDGVQVRFLSIGGGDVTSLQTLLDANRADILERVPGFRSFTAGGDSHTILGRDFFYTFKVGDTSFRDWFAALVAGQDVESVHCRESAAGCAQAELLETSTAG